MRHFNIGILAHVDAGKTTITEQLLYQSGMLRTIGSVDQGTSLTDFMEVERERGISVQSSVATITRGDLELNIIDTPGHVDFAAEVERSLEILDAAVLVVSAVDGVQAQTELLYQALQQTGTNVILFINKIDSVGSDTSRALKELEALSSVPLLAINQPVDEGGRQCGVCPPPDYAQRALDAAASANDALLERYVNGEDISTREVEAAVREQIADGRLIPVLFGSGLMGVGTRELLDFLQTVPAPEKRHPDNALSAVVYKISHDKTMGRIAHVRLFGGTLKNRDTVRLSSGQEQKVTQIRKYNGARYTDVGEAASGEVVALTGLSNARVSDIIGEAYHAAKVELSVPLLSVQVLPEQKAQLHQVLAAFEELSAEDPKLNVQYHPDEQEIVISVLGAIQLEVLAAIVRERYGLTVAFSAPTVIYKETPSKPGNGFDAYTMPKPCWAIVSLDIEPGKRGSGLQYRSVVNNNQIFYRYQNHIETAVPRALQQGLKNWEVTDLKVTLVGGEHHTVHTHPMDFFLATPIAVMKGLQNTGTTLLEPMQTVKIVAGEAVVGKVIGDMIAMRGQYDSPSIHNGMFTLEGRVPVATSLDYPIRLASLTSGKGTISTRFDGYEVCPDEFGQVAKRRGVNPLDRDRWILHMRNALQG